MLEDRKKGIDYSSFTKSGTTQWSGEGISGLVRKEGSDEWSEPSINQIIDNDSDHFDDSISLNPLPKF